MTRKSSEGANHSNPPLLMGLPEKPIARHRRVQSDMESNAALGRFTTGNKKSAAPTKGCRTGISPAANILPLAVVSRADAALRGRYEPIARHRRVQSDVESNAALGEIPRTGPQREKKHTPSSVLRAGERYLRILEHGITLGSTLIFPVC